MKKVTLTVPQMQHLLSNQSNRNLSGNWCKWHRMMMDGRWNPEISPILLYEDDGSLADGQHRLRAAVEIGKPFVCYVGHIGRNDICNVDAGRPRQAWDAARILGFDYSKADLAAARYALWCEYGRWDKLMPHADIIEAAERYRVQSWRVSLNELYGRSMLQGIVSFVAYHGMEEQAGKFHQDVVIGSMIKPGEPAYALRRLMIASRMSAGSGGGQGVVEWHYKMVKSWNAFVRGERIDKLYLPKQELRFLAPLIQKEAKDGNTPNG